MGHESEAQLERKLIIQLQNQGYDYVKITDEAALKINLKKQMNQHNEASL